MPLAVVIPVGPRDLVADTVRSALHYLERPRAVVLVDDSRGDGDVREAQALGDEVHVLPAPPGADGGQGGLWVKLAAGYRHVVENLHFDAILRLDADALVIGPGLEHRVRDRFARDPAVGMLGSYRVGSDGSERDWSPAAELLAAETALRGLRKPGLRRLLRQVAAAARRNGYVPGEHPLGGAYVHSAAAARALHERGWLDLPGVARSRLGEDHIFGLLTVAAGFRIADFGGPDDPLALRWRGLPAHPDELLARRKLVTHSVRFWDELDEAAIRGIFAERRAS